ncbi:MAG: CvpA family protein [Clostridiales bacterium]|nr:CvpA family protein [Clostridiales bacterium]
MNWLLIVVFGILIINGLIGRKVGFIKIVFSLCSLIITLILTSFISPTVNDLLISNEKVYQSVVDKVETILSFEDEETSTNEEVGYIEGLPMPKSIKDALIENNNTDKYKSLAVEGFKDYVSSYLAGVIINSMAFILTFLVILIALWIISIALNLISKLPILNGLNKTMGMVAGLLQGLLLVWVFFIVITIFSGSQMGHDALEMIETSEILRFIYNNNFLMQFVIGATQIFI